MTGPTAWSEFGSHPAWGWDVAVPAAYTYTFTLTNVGCLIRVADNRGGAIDLVDPADW